MISLTNSQLTTIAKKLRMNITVEDGYTFAKLHIDGSEFTIISWPNACEKVPDSISMKIFKSQLFIDCYDEAYGLRDCSLGRSEYIQIVEEKCLIRIYPQKTPKKPI